MLYSKFLFICHWFGAKNLTYCRDNTSLLKVIIAIIAFYFLSHTFDLICAKPITDSIILILSFIMVPLHRTDFSFLDIGAPLPILFLLSAKITDHFS